MASDRPHPLSAITPYLIAMAAIIALSNVLVQYPVQFTLLGVKLQDMLTWGAFTYPIAYLVTDLANRNFGPATARQMVMVGFVLAVILSFWLATPRIAIASGTAFLTAQLLDVAVFDRLRNSQWWHAPLFSSLVGSVVDSLLFFGLAFSPVFSMLDFGGPDTSLGFAVPFLGVGGDVPLWISLAAGDQVVKLIVGLSMLVPYGVIIGATRQA